MIIHQTSIIMKKTYAQTGHMCCNNLPKIQPGFDMSPDFHSAGHVCCHRCAVPALLGTRPLCFNNAVERGADDAVEGRAGGVSDAHHEQVWVRNMFGQVKNSWDGFWRMGLFHSPFFELPLRWGNVDPDSPGMPWYDAQGFVSFSHSNP